jgi:hypothetical protein
MLKTSSGSRSGQSALAGLEKTLAGRDPDDSVIPGSVRKAVKFMLGGALVTAVAGLFSLITVISDPDLINSGKKPTSSALTGDIVEVIILTIVYCALWVLMTRMNRSGHVWARIVASVLFAFSTISLYTAVNSLHGGQTILVVNIISFVLEVAEWVCGCGAIALLWRSESSVYFKAHSGRALGLR